MRNLILITLFFSIVGCTESTPENQISADTKIQGYLAKKNLEFERTSTGLYMKILEKGFGDSIRQTDLVTFTYEGKLLDGAPFDVSHAQKPISFQVKKLIKAWQEAMQYVRKGGKISLIVPPHLGYGDSDIEKIPANSVLLFDLTVVNVE